MTKKINLILLATLFSTSLWASGSWKSRGVAGMGASTNGAQSVLSHAVAIDIFGNQFIAGAFFGTVDFGGVSLTSRGNNDAFVAKYKPNGDLIFVRQASGALGDSAYGLALDRQGNIYVTGQFSNALNCGNGFAVNSANGPGVFVWKLNTDGSTAWCSGTSSSVSAVGLSIAVDPAGNNIAIGGSYSGTMTLGKLSLVAPAGVTDGFMAKLGAAGNFLWASQFVGSAASSSQINGVVITSAGNVAGAGRFSGTVNFNPINVGMPTTSVNGVANLSLVSLNGATGLLNYFYTAGNAKSVEATGIATAPGERIYIAGDYQGTVDFTASHSLTAPANATGFFLLGFNSSGALTFANDLGGSNSDTTHTKIGRVSVAASNYGSVVVGATVTGPVNIGRFSLGGTGAADILLESFDGNGHLTRATTFGGPNDDALRGVAINNVGQVAHTGSYAGLILFDTSALSDKFDTAVAGNNIYVASLIPVSAPVCEFDGALNSEASVFNPRTNAWSVLGYFGPASYGVFGVAGDIPVPGDYTGVGHAQLAVFRPSTANWLLENTDGSTTLMTNFGGPNLMDVPVPGDYDGLGKTEPAVFRPATNQWFVHSPVSNRLLTTFGQAGDIPAPGDYDNVGYTEPAIFRPSTGTWWVLGPTGVHQVATFGNLNLTDIPAPGDYDNVGQTQPAIFRPGTGEWIVLGPQGPHVFAVYGGTDLGSNYPLPGTPGSLKVLGRW